MSSSSIGIKKLVNPLEEDPLLKELLKQLDRIETRRGFAKWKAQFLEQFEVHLEGTNVTKAGHKYHSFAKRLDRLALLLKALEGLITAGECSAKRCSVKSRQSLSDLQTSLTQMIEHTEALVPGTLETERAAGYTKFDMGAVLVRDGFVEYDRLCICNEILLHMRDIALNDVADRQLLEEMDRYWQKVQAFYQIMGTDLGLHGAIMRCREILRAEDDEFFELEKEDSSSFSNHTGSRTNSQRGGRQGSSNLDASNNTLSTGQWEDEEPSKTQQRFEKVEIYGLDLPLRLIKIGDDGDEASSSRSDLSSVSDYESWCWELELPEPTPNKKPKVMRGDEADMIASAAEKERRRQEQQERLSGRMDAMQSAARKGAVTAAAMDEDKDDDEDDESRRTKNEKLRYKWTGKDYYQNDAKNWRIAGTLKRIGKDDDDS